MSAPGVYPFAPPPAVAATLFLSSGDLGTAETVEQMCRLIDAGSKDPEINRLGVFIIRQAGVPEFNFEGERRAIYQWFRQNIRFLRDIDGKEALRAARETIANRMGDCDCQTIAIGALLKTIGQRVRIVTVATQPQAPDQFSHVFLEVRDERGRWIPVDTARRRPRYGLAPRSWFRRYGWDTETCKAIDLDNPQAAAEFDSDDDVGQLSGLGLGAPFGTRWGSRGMGQGDVRSQYWRVKRLTRVRLSRLRGLGQDDGSGFDVSQLESLAPSILQSTAQLVAASRATPATLAPAAMAPAAQAALMQAETSPTAALASIPSWVWLLGGGLLLVMAMKGGGGRR